MRTLTIWGRGSVLAAGAALVAACGGDSTAVSDDLRRDLELASAASVSMPNAAERTRFVSALEQGADAAPRAVAPSRSPGRVAPRAQAHAAHHAPVAAEPAPAEEVAPVEEAAPPAETPVVATAAGESSTVASVPEANEPGMGSSAGEPSRGPSADEGRGRGIGDAIGGVIGVVIRGGAVGVDDHCERDRPGRGRIPYPTADVGGWGGPAIGRGTFGGRGGGWRR